MLAWEDKKELVTSGSHLVGPPGDVQTEAKLEKSVYLKTDKNEHRSIIIGGIELPRASVSKCGITYGSLVVDGNTRMNTVSCRWRSVASLPCNESPLECLMLKVYRAVV